MADLSLPPQNIEAEEAVLGSLLIDPEAALRIAPFLKHEMFYVVKNGWIYDSVLKLQERHEAIDLLTVSSELAKDNRLDEIGGESYLAQLVNTVPTALNVETYAHIVEEMATRRRMLNAASEIARIAYDKMTPIDQVVEKSEAAVFAVTEGSGDGQMVSMRTAVNDFFERIEYLHEHRDEPLGIPTGYPDLDKLTGGMNRGDLVIVAARPGVGKCVTAKTKLINPCTGELIAIQELVAQRDADLLTLGEDLKLRHARASNFVDDGLKPVYRVKTALGREIEATATHPFLMIDGWRMLEHVTVGEHIAVPRVLPVFGQFDAPEHEVKLLAYLISDGCLTGNNPQFTNSNPVLREDFTEAALQFPGAKVRVENSRGSRTPTVYVSGDYGFIVDGRKLFAERLRQAIQHSGETQKWLANEVGVHPSAVVEWLKGDSTPDAKHFASICAALQVSPDALAADGIAAIQKKGPNSLTHWLQAQGLWGLGAAEKDVPRSVFRYTRRKLALFLNRLFACDGSLFTGNRAGISYSTVSLKLAQSVQHLLLRFGVLGKLRTRQVRYTSKTRGLELRTAYEVQVTHRDSLQIFIDEIGALGKEDAARRICERLAGTQGNVNLDTVPAGVWSQIEAAKGPRSWRQLILEMGLREDGNLHVGKRSIGRARLGKIAEIVQAPHLAQLADSDVYWDEVVEIEPIGLQQVYDLTVPDTHNFVANDVIVHNTSLMLNLAYNAAYRHRQRVAVFSLEMGVEQLVQRFIASETGIDSQRLRIGDLRDDEWANMTKISMQMADLMVFMDDTPSLTPLDLRVKARRIYQEHGLDLIVVDYLQLMTSEGAAGRGGSDNRVQEISHISRNLKQIARELKVPLIAGSQLSRLVEQRSDKRPMLSDLRESGCLAGNTLVTLVSGERVPIRDLQGKTNFRIWALDEQFQLVQATVSKAFATGVKPVFKLTTQLGRSIVATGNHKFRAFSEWRRLDELEVGMHIALPRQICPPDRDSLSSAQLALLGHLLGDGCILPNHAIQYTTREFDLAEAVSAIAKEAFGNLIEPRIKQERKWYQVYLASTRHHTHGVRNVIAEWLDGLGVWGLRSHEKFVPAEVFIQSGQGIATFLRHLWVTDGCIRMRYGKSTYPAVYYATSSVRLAEDVQSLLLRLGINARVKSVSQQGKGRDQFHVIVSGKSDLENFVNQIGTLGRYKSNSLEEIRSYLMQLEENTNRDIIPSDMWSQYVKPTMAKMGITHRELHRKLEMAYSGMTLFKQNVSRARASRIAVSVQSPKIGALADSMVYWDQIVSIEPLGEEEVFDLTVPGPHNFVANDIIAHNSIEQDADIVTFIYRDEVYNPDTDQKNIAEISVQKNRNGPTGKVNLFFDKRLTSFKNLAREKIEL